MPISPNAEPAAADMRRPAFSYARFSSPAQARGDSLRRQTAKARGYAQRKNLRYEDRSFHDLGLSAFRGANFHFGALGEFVRAVQEGKVPRDAYLLVENLDRISRQTAMHAAHTLQAICQEGITLVTLDDEREYTIKSLEENPFEFMWIVMKFMRAHDESERKGVLGRANWHRKRELAKAETRPMTARCPAWLELKGKRFQIIPERAAVVRRIFELAAIGVGQQQIADILNREGVPTFGDHFTSRKAEFWRRSYIKKIIESGATVGVLRTHELLHLSPTVKRRQAVDVVPDYFPAVVPRDLFERVRAMRLAQSPTPRAGKKGIQNPLAGLAKCPKCSATMTRVNKGSGTKAGKPYLVCTRAKYGKACEYVSVPLDAVRDSLAFNVGSLADQAPSHDADLETQLRKWGDEFAATNRRINEITEALTDEPSAALAAILAKEQRRSQSVHEQLQRALLEAEAMTSPVLRSRLDELDAALNGEDVVGKMALVNALMRQCFTEVVVDYDRDVLRLVWHVGGEAVISMGEKGHKYAPFFFMATLQGTMRPIDGKEDLGPRCAHVVQSIHEYSSIETANGVDEVLQRASGVLRDPDVQPARRYRPAYRPRAA